MHMTIITSMYPIFDILCIYVHFSYFYMNLSINISKHACTHILQQQFFRNNIIMYCYWYLLWNLIHKSLINASAKVMLFYVCICNNIIIILPSDLNHTNLIAYFQLLMIQSELIFTSGHENMCSLIDKQTGKASIRLHTS